MTHNIICSDNISALNKINENTFDSCITDPPYGMGMDDWDHTVPPVEIWEAVYRTLKPGAFVLSFCSPELYHRMAINVEDAGFRPLDMITWIVTTKMAKTNRLKPAHEPIFVAQKPLQGSIKANVEAWGCGEIDIEDARIPWDKEPPTYPTGGHQRRAFGKDVSKEKQGKKKANIKGRYPSDVIGHFDDPDHQKYFYAPRATRKERGEYNDHPTPKPISLMRYLVRVYSPKGGHVLDPFNGSGSTGIAAIQEGSEFTGIDMSQHYCDIAEKRIADHCAETPFEKLFDYEK
jgi:site-specific DNA-methyltransferase (adenine-specific)